jgi:hypothetical protein
MSDEHNDGGPAFPAMTPGGYCTPGMSLRDWFAGQALQGLIAQCNMPNDIYARMSYSIADQMLRLRDPDTTTAQQIALGLGGGK